MAGWSYFYLARERERERWLDSNRFPNRVRARSTKITYLTTCQSVGERTIQCRSSVGTRVCATPFHFSLIFSILKKCCLLSHCGSKFSSLELSHRHTKLLIYMDLFNLFSITRSCLQWTGITSSQSDELNCGHRCGRFIEMSIDAPAQWTLNWSHKLTPNGASDDHRRTTISSVLANILLLPCILNLFFTSYRGILVHWPFLYCVAARANALN